jgi:hypothetical protein
VEVSSQITQKRIIEPYKYLTSENNNIKRKVKTKNIANSIVNGKYQIKFYMNTSIPELLNFVLNKLIKESIF